MSFFNKNNDDEKKWKEKYLDLLDKQESTEKSQHKLQSSYSKAFTRLALAAQGFNQQLDPYLDQIRNQLKNSDSSELCRELEDFSQALLKITDSRSKQVPNEIQFLFDFLYKQYQSSNSTCNSLKLLASNYQQNDLDDPQALFAAILKIIIPETDNTQTVLTQSAEPEIKIEKSGNAQIDTKLVSKKLIHLLNELEIPAEFEEQSQALIKQLNSQLANDSFQAVLDDTTNLLINIKNHQQNEHKDIEAFLSDLTKQLTDLGIQASGANSIVERVIQKRNNLDQSVSAQMLDLQTSSSEATKLEPLKKLIHASLDSIAKQISEHKKEEETQRIESASLMGKLVNKIAQLESESIELKSSLHIAHNKALRDPLTGLPNRLAYDERLALEIAQWQRNKTPLSLIIWDIDHFKNINDSYGHKAGDKTLVLIAKLLTEHCRKTDFVSRFGGEEFTMLLPNTDAKAAFTLADKLRKIVRKAGFNFAGNAISITISCGIAQFAEDETHDNVFKRADEALYKAKNAGRNQCIIG